MDSITIDGLEEMEFRRSIESLLRRGRADDAADKLKSLLERYSGEGRILPERFLSVTSHDVRLEGWEQLGEKLREYDRPEMAMSAISIDILDPQGVGARPDAEGRLKPVIETSYFSDSAYPFSEADREDLLDGYSSFGCEWQGNFENVDTTISIEGIDDLYGAAVGLENKVANSSKVEDEEIQAGSVGSCYLAVLIHQAIRDAARDKGLPRPICVLAGSNDAYPFFDAPAMTVDEYRQDGNVAAADGDARNSQFNGEFEDDAQESAGGMASLESLIGLGGKKKEKTPVLVIDPSEADTVETLEMNVAGASEADERLHIMPTVDFGAGSPPEYTETPSDEAVPHWEPEPEDWRGDEQAVPADFGGQPASTPTGWEADEPVAERAAPFGLDEPEQPAPIDFTSREFPLRPDWEAREMPTRIDFSAYGMPAPADAGDEEQPDPLERFYSEEADSATGSPPPDEPVGGPDHGDAAPREWPGPADWGSTADNSPADDFPATDPHGFNHGDAEAHEWPEPPEWGGTAGSPPVDDVPAADPHGFDQDGDDLSPPDLERFSLRDEPGPDDWALAFDLPTGDETGDNPPWQDGSPERHYKPRMEEPRPARHSIRVIAASVSNEGNTGQARPGAGGGSLLPGWLAWIVSSLGWLRKRLTRR